MNKPATSRRTRAATSHHHGDLRQALISATLAQLEDAGVAGISLRGVAKSVGVSHMAPYNHFQDKAALIAAAAAEGFRQLKAAMSERMAKFQPGDPKRFQATGIAYAVFAVEHPELFRLMFGPELADKHDHPELAAAASEVRGSLLGGMADSGIPLGGSALGPAGLASWSLVHGVAMLAVAQQLPSNAAQSIEALTREVTNLLYHGLANWPPADREQRA